MVELTLDEATFLLELAVRFRCVLRDEYNSDLPEKDAAELKRLIAKIQAAGSKFTGVKVSLYNRDEGTLTDIGDPQP